MFLSRKPFVVNTFSTPTRPVEIVLLTKKCLQERNTIVGWDDSGKIVKIFILILTTVDVYKIYTNTGNHVARG